MIRMTGALRPGAAVAAALLLGLLLTATIGYAGSRDNNRNRQ
jgi:hypothetical protein